MLVMVFSLGACRESSKYYLEYFKSIEELQKIAPDFYYFNFDLENITLVSCSAKGMQANSKIKCDYSRISFYFEPQNSFVHNGVIIETTKHSKFLWLKPLEKAIDDDFYGKRSIDSIDCYLFYGVSASVNRTTYVVYIFFDIEDIRYNFDFYLTVDNDQITEEMTLNYFVEQALSIAKPAIENRSKESKN